MKAYKCLFSKGLSGRKEAMEFISKLFICPQCSKQTLTIHKKTYEKVILAFCINCHFNSSFEPSKEAYYDPNKTWEELTADYKRTQASSQVLAN